MTGGIGIVWVSILLVEGRVAKVEEIQESLTVSAVGLGVILKTCENQESLTVSTVGLRMPCVILNAHIRLDALNFFSFQKHRFQRTHPILLHLIRRVYLGPKRLRKILCFNFSFLLTIKAPFHLLCLNRFVKILEKGNKIKIQYFVKPSSLLVDCWLWNVRTESIGVWTLNFGFWHWLLYRNMK